MAGAAASVAMSLALLFVGVPAASAGPLATNPVPPPASGAYLGVFADAAPGQSGQLQSFDTTIGRHVAIASFFTGWSGPAPLGAMEQALSVGAVPMLSWICGPPDQEVSSGGNPAIIRNMAIQLKSLERPVLLRWFWEMNLPLVNARCLGTAGASGYVNAYQEIWNIFQQVGATNVSFVWAPSASANAPSAAPYYPGSAYVSWIGSDIYDRLQPKGTDPCQVSQDFATEYAPFYAQWSTEGKPLLLSETGVGCTAETSTQFPAFQADWLGEIGQAVPAQFPDLRGVVYMDAAEKLGNYVLTGAGLTAYAALGKEAALTPMPPGTGASDGYDVLRANGGVDNFGAPWYGSLAGRLPSGVTATGLAVDPATGGYWVLTSNGAVSNFDAPWEGSPKAAGGGSADTATNPVVAISAAPGGAGYYVLRANGGVDNFGAPWYGSLAASGNAHARVVAIAADPIVGGYRLVTSLGGVYSFGTPSYGSVPTGTAPPLAVGIAGQG